MSELLELVFNLLGGLLEIVGECSGDFLWPDTKAGRIIWCVILVILGSIIWWECR
jgi:hypothetical protein